MTDRSAEIAARLVELAALLAKEQRQEEEQEHSVPQPRSQTDRELLTVSEAAQRLGIGRTKAYSLVRSGELASVLIGRLRRVPASEVTRYTAHLAEQQKTV
ncbi:helix-turn-helix domain-containing protein [Actinopolyspora mortivallis]|uniref:DNA-binding protein n=1 Tax=Actinopolyspora mortivallis TaxID=33906 RepID=A0A2T0GV77_ACTMO|nr:helix-turn-helix domain-containing protein [Actinopolyspora mortivallis]PRW63026.1 DNA-binding protein [Actinopolyspora mortivallis]